ncbi:MAG: aminodeoxychorismate synthase component I [bacterium]
MQIFADKKFKNPIKIIQAFDNESFLEAFSQIENLRKRPNHYLLGYIRYEAKEIFLGKKIKSKLPILYFEVFGEVKSELKSNTCYSVPLFSCSPKPQINYKIYSKAIERIKQEIACGNTYQVNYTYDYKIKTQINGFDLYNAILPNQITPFNAYIKNEYEEILSFSPELFFELENNKIKTKPMKGTVKRGENQVQDKANIEFLKNDTKNRAENVMIVDLLRNDLGKIAKTGTVKVDKLFAVETHKTLHQMTSEVSAELEEDITLFEIFEAIFPCGSITGAPKINTMEIIDELEIGSREVYCGAIGLISSEKTVFSVPIRILQKKNNEGFYSCRVGGAIVWDSTSEDEWDETLTKIQFLSTSDVDRTYLPENIKLVETILVENGKIKYKKEHFERMRKSAKDLGFEFNLEKLNFPIFTSSTFLILRILLSREGVFETQILPLKEITTKKIFISKTPVNSKELLLKYKTTCRVYYDEAMKKIKLGLIFDEIFFNEKGELTEGARSNIVLQIGGELFTPPVKCGLLGGILREKMIKSGKIRTKKLYLSDLKKSEKVFCINSVRGIVEVEVDG